MIKVRIKKVPKARTGYQVQGALANDVPAMGGADYNAYIGQPKLRESKYITAVPREEANLEAEGGETVYGDINGDGMPEHKIIKGPRHAQGGVALSLPEDTFIFSDTRSMKIKDPAILAMFGKAGSNKSFTPAELAKQYDIQKYRKILEDPDSDAIERKTAELMIKKFVVKLGCLALVQESMKGFPQGIPAVAKPCLEAKGISEEEILPNQEISALNEQLKQQMEQQGGGEEGQMQQAMDMNQGQPVAQPQEMQQPSPEEMMQYGGMRRLRRAQEGMQQPSPEEMAMMQEQQGEGDEMMQILQEVQGALQRGAEPAEVVMSLLQNGLPPEAIVQVFTQLGASQQEAAGLVQQVMAQGQGGGQEEMMAQQQPMSEEEAMMMQQQQQAAPMAMYGMSMGGYEMPFFDIPQAEYGMAMGSGMSQNYQGRPKRIPGSGPITRMVKAQSGIEIDATNMTEEQLQRAIWDQQQKDKNAQIIVTRKDPSGQTKKQKLKTSGFYIPEGKDIKDLKGFPDTPAGRVAASQYLLIEQNLNNPIVRAEIIKNTKAAINNADAWTGKGGTKDPNRTWSKIYGTEPSDDEIIQQALNHQKRNLMFEANEVDPQLFTDIGSGLDTVDKILSEGYVNPKTGKPYTKAEAAAELKRLNDAGYTSVANMSEKLGVPLDPKGKDRVLQQATMHGYAKSYKDFESGAYDSNPDAKYAMDNFLGNVSLVHSGASDETSMGTLYGAIGNKISPLDDRYDYSSNNWYQKNSRTGKLERGKFTTYGDTTAGHKYMVGQRKLEFEDLSEETPASESVSKKCPCQKSDGTVLEMTAYADGSCPPCEEDMDINVPGKPSGMWLQDTIKTTGAFGDLMGINKYMPFAPGVDLETPRPTFLDPTRDLGANAEQATIQTQALAQFAGPQALSARSAGVQGLAAKNAADILAKYNNANVNLGNQFELKSNDIRNQESTLRQATAQRLYDQNTIANQQFDNAELAMGNNLRNYYTNAITNRWKTDALNQLYTSHAVDPTVGGMMKFQPTERAFDGQKSGGMTMQEAIDWCKQNNPNATDHSACMQRVMNTQNKTASSEGTGANAGVINTMYPSQMGGPVFADGGYVYINSWLPFIM
jgi:hypothetical protein